MASGDKVSNGVIITPAPHARPRAHMSSTTFRAWRSVLFSHNNVTPTQQDRQHFDGSPLPHSSGGPKGSPRPRAMQASVHARRPQPCFLSGLGGRDGRPSLAEKKQETYHSGPLQNGL